MQLCTFKLIGTTDMWQCSCRLLHGLSLADRSGIGDLRLLLVIGGRYYCEKCTIESVALARKLGYVLSGPTLITIDNDNSNTVNLKQTHVLKVEASVVIHDVLTSELGKALC